ncbi:MAG: hypothetical protein PWQ42_884 [Sulfurospirillum sp.]|jgi:hypothetical protein|nr:hypothetical protein [Sulfurospirillum sp.]DAB33578.1 MAG TPA: hypothetical protein CFH82_09815 [Sulfurospirillum sp. UBA12182]
MKTITKILATSVLVTTLFAANPFYGGVVKEVIHAGGYTYLLVQEKNAGSFWAAVSSVGVKVGDEVRFQKEFVANKFHSKALNRDFEELMFASNIEYKVK